MLQILIIHWDLSHHITRHIARKPARLTMIKPICVFVSSNLRKNSTSSYFYNFRLGFWIKECIYCIHVFVCIYVMQQQTNSEKKGGKSHQSDEKGDRKWRKKTFCLLTHLTVVTPAQTGNTIGSFKEHFELMKRWNATQTQRSASV